MKVSHRTASKLISCEKSKFELASEKIAELRLDWEQDHSRASYQALLKHDREWILEQRGQKIIGRLPVPVGRDGDLASEIRAAIARIKDRGGKITLTALSEEVGFRLVRTHLDEYPLSKAEVLAVCPIPPWLHQRRRTGRKKSAADITSRSRSKRPKINRVIIVL
jgi:hypothetical protein